MKNKYDTAVVFLYATGNEHLLPEEFRKQIPYTTIFGWRRTDFGKYLGHEFRYFFDDSFDNAKVISENLKMKRAMRGFARSWILLAKSFLPILKNATKDKELQKNILAAINCMQLHIGLDKSLKMIGLSKTLYHQWVLEARFDCFDSFASLCVKRHPQQLELKEIEKIKNMLIDPAYDHWPIVSIAGFALRSKKVIACLYSWYKYARMFNITKKPFKKIIKTVGLIAKCPNEYLHIDVTHYALVSGQKIYISFVMDNYSKMILGFHVSDKKDFSLTRTAIADALKTILLHPNQKHSFLVTDGGRENHNKQVDQFIYELSDHKMTKITALKHIQFSNSPVEAVHRTVKGRYLRSRKFDTIESVILYLQWVKEDYNVARPHYKHRPRTPHEVYFGKKLNFDLKKRVKDAVAKRIQNNKCAKCMQCTGFCKKDKVLMPGAKKKG